MPAREKVARGRKYAVAEDLELARAWVQVSTDALVGINQTAKDFWCRVKDIMESSELISVALASGKMPSRTWLSLQAHFGQIQKSIAKYVSCSTHVESLRTSGSTERDMMKQALALYKERYNQHFAYVECYDLLSRCPKFEKGLDRVSGRGQSLCSGKRSVSEEEAETTNIGQTLAGPPTSDNTENERPNVGVKAAKRGKVERLIPLGAVKAQETLASSMTLKVKVLKEQLHINQAQQRLQEEQVLHTMLNGLFSTLPASREHATYLENRRANLLRRLDTVRMTSPQMPPLDSATAASQDLAALLSSDASSTPSSPENADATAQDRLFPSDESSTPPSTLSTGDNSSLATFASQDYNLPPSSDISSTLSSSFTTASFPPLTQLSDTPASSIEFTD
ncbi:No apical meristem-associated C-terminal domain [Phytophthora infestans]|uniref:No apical meristem-associated C-terminal domain n=1 Tax=Phytophthora infestans TaxID=4787 RepID=A0A8S9VGS5_PHYIN|nr:No apical meristem-associated C-terminal domain [Phytophthora infestans]